MTLSRALTLLITGYPPGKIKLPTLSFYLPPVAVVPALRDLGMHSGYSFARAMGVRQMIKYRYSYLKSYESKFGNSVRDGSRAGNSLSGGKNRRF